MGRGNRTSSPLELRVNLRDFLWEFGAADLKGTRRRDERGTAGGNWKWLEGRKGEVLA